VEFPIHFCLVYFVPNSIHNKNVINAFFPNDIISFIKHTKLGTGCKDTLVICNSIFFIFLNQIKAQRDQKIIVWVEYFPYKYSFKVISMTNAIKLLLQMTSVSLQPVPSLEK
jgi:hypothetical protein